MTRRKGILGTTEIKRNILLTFWDKKKRDFLLRLRDGRSIYIHIMVANVNPKDNLKVEFPCFASKEKRR
jgi:hypothetical protein